MNELVPTEIDPEVRLPSVNHESLEADAMNLVRGYLNGDIEFHDPIETGYKAPPPAEELAVEE